MIANDLTSHFPIKIYFLDAMDGWKKFAGKAATYIMVSGKKFGRLIGTSDILYIGSTDDLGKRRLWNYKYKTIKQEERIHDLSVRLVKLGISVTLQVCQSPPDSRSVQEYESYLLSKYEEEHLELPPWNRQGPS